MKTNGYICNYCKKYKDLGEERSVSFPAYVGDVNGQPLSVIIDLCHDCAERLLQLTFMDNLYFDCNEFLMSEILTEEGILG